MASGRLYVGHLSYKARETDVEDLFGRYGKIREILLKNGFGFVEFDDPRDAEEAVYRCNGKEIRGDRIIVELTKRPPRGRDTFRFGDRGSSGGGRGDRDRPSYNGGGSGGRSNFYREPTRRREDNYPTQTRYRVIVENLSSRVSWQDLKDMMRSAGEVTYADAHRIKPNEGVVCYRRSEDLKRALDTLDGKEMHGRKIKLVDGTRDGSRHRFSSSRSRSRSRSNSSRRSSRSRSKSKSSRSRSRSRSRSDSRSRSRSASSKRSDTAAKNGKDKQRSQSKERSASPDNKRRASSRSHSPAAENGRRSPPAED